MSNIGHDSLFRQLPDLVPMSNKLHIQFQFQLYQALHLCLAVFWLIVQLKILTVHEWKTIHDRKLLI